MKWMKPSDIEPAHQHLLDIQYDLSNCVNNNLNHSTNNYDYQKNDCFNSMLTH